MNKNFVKKNECPYCSHKVDSAFNESDEKVLPIYGDLALCIKCGEVAQFDEELTLIKFNLSKLNAQELMDIRRKQFIISQFHYKESILQ